LTTQVINYYFQKPTTPLRNLTNLTGLINLIKTTSNIIVNIEISIGATTDYQFPGHIFNILMTSNPDPGFYIAQSFIQQYAFDYRECTEQDVVDWIKSYCEIFPDFLYPVGRFTLKDNKKWEVLTGVPLINYSGRSLVGSLKPSNLEIKYCIIEEITDLDSYLRQKHTVLLRECLQEIARSDLNRLRKSFGTKQTFHSVRTKLHNQLLKFS
jgi:hypothetical protein